MTFSPDGRFVAYDLMSAADASERDVFVVAVRIPSARPIRIGAEHVIVDQDVGSSERFHPLSPGFHRLGIDPDFVVWQYGAELHGLLPIMSSPRRAF